MKLILKIKENLKFKFVTEVFAMKGIKIELLGIATILLGIAVDKKIEAYFENKI